MFSGAILCIKRFQMDNLDYFIEACLTENIHCFHQSLDIPKNTLVGILVR